MTQRLLLIQTKVFNEYVKKINHINGENTGSVELQVDMTTYT